MQALLAEASRCSQCLTRRNEGKAVVVSWCQPHEWRATEISKSD